MHPLNACAGIKHRSVTTVISVVSKFKDEQPGTAVMEFQNPRQASDLITTGCGTVVVAGKRRGDGVSCGTSHGSRVGRKDAVVISKLESTVTEEQRAFRGLRVSWDSFMRVRRTSHAPLAFAGEHTSLGAHYGSGFSCLIYNSFLLQGDAGAEKRVS